MQNRLTLDTETDIPLGRLTPASSVPADRKIAVRMRKQSRVSVDYVREVVEYRDGRIFYRERPRSHFKGDKFWKHWNGRNAGREAGYVHEGSRGSGPRWWVTINLPGNTGTIRILRSAIVWGLCKGEFPCFLVDHKDGDSLNDNINNLRPCTNGQNRANTAVNRNSRSGLKGVSARGNGWVAEIQVNKQRIYLGYFSDKEEAYRVYLEAGRKHFGEFFKGA